MLANILDLLSRASIGATILLYPGYWLVKQVFRPSERIAVNELYIHPVKSCGPIALQQAKFSKYGFKLDREFMLVDVAAKRFVSQRSLPMMARIKVVIVDQQLVATADGHPPLIIAAVTDTDIITLTKETVDLTNAVGSTAPPQGEKVECVLWRDTLTAQIVSKVHDDWFSAVLDKPVHLVAHLPESRELERSYYAPEGQVQHVAFPDGYPLLITSTASLHYLNKQLPDPVSVLHFRPNIVVEGCVPHGEDWFYDITIANTQLKCRKPCGRCSVPTVNPATGAKHPDNEPITTLKRYRSRGQEVYFGNNAINTTAGGVVQVGDLVTVTSTQVGVMDQAS